MSIEVRTFQVRCPMDNTLHDALAQISIADGEQFVATTECHKSWECDTCKECLLAMCGKYERGEITLGIMEKPL